MTTPKTVKTGDTADDRVVLSGAHTDVPTADPAADDKGFSLQGADWMHVYLELTGITGLNVTPWYYSKTAEQWTEGNQIAFTTASQSAIVETRGEEYVFLVADAVTGTGSFKLWAAYNFDGKAY